MPPTDSPLLNDLFSPTLQNVFENLPLCLLLFHCWLEAFKSPQNILGLLSETQKCRFFSLENTSYCFAAMGTGGSILMPPSLLVSAHLEIPGERAFSVEGKCKDQGAWCWDSGVSARPSSICSPVMLVSPTENSCLCPRSFSCADKHHLPHFLRRL